MYAQGLGIEKNLELAEQWLQKAAVQGHLKAQKSLEILKKNIQVSE
jgi:TPR repeat protein